MAPDIDALLAQVQVEVIARRDGTEVAIAASSVVTGDVVVLIAAGAVCQNLAFTATLMACLAAFGASIPPLAALVVFMLWATVAAVSPTPGGLGAMEAA